MDIILNKVETIKRCIVRINEEFYAHESNFETNYTVQDSVILNLERACQASIDLAAHIIKKRELGIPQKTRDVFIFLENEELISSNLSKKLQKMVGFRNIAVHDYQKLNLDVVKYIVQNRINDFVEFYERVLKLES